jgi:hypothetical protein
LYKINVYILFSGIFSEKEEDERMKKFWKDMTKQQDPLGKEKTPNN